MAPGTRLNWDRSQLPSGLSYRLLGPLHCECEYHFEPILDLYNLLYDNGYEQFKIEITAGKNKQYGAYKTMTIWLLKSDGTWSDYSKHKGSV